MAGLIPEETTYLLLVEGKEDQEFFIRLGRSLSYDTDSWLLRIVQYGGRTDLAARLRTLARPDTMEGIERVGIVRDSDFRTDAFSSVQDAIRNSHTEHTIQLPVPIRAGQWTEPIDDLPSVGVLVLPSQGRDGMLEDVVMDIFVDDPITSCVDSFFECVSDSTAVLDHKLSKARLRAFITGKNVSEDADGDDSDKLYLSDIFHMSWWKQEFWNHLTFKDAKAFLTQLLDD